MRGNASGQRVIAIIPAYNEEATVAEVVRSVQEHVPNVLVVDDASCDRTAQVAREAGAVVVSHVLNRGVGAALRTGYRYALECGFDVIVQIDADGQHDPRYIPELLQALNGGCDVVIGSRFLNESYREHSWVRRVGIRFFTWVGNRLGGANITDITSGYRAYRAEALKRLGRHPDRHWAVEQTLEAARKRLKIREISVKMPARQKGKSQFTLGTFLGYPLRMLDSILRVLLFRRS